MGYACRVSGTAERVWIGLLWLSFGSGAAEEAASERPDADQSEQGGRVDHEGHSRQEVLISEIEANGAEECQNEAQEIDCAGKPGFHAVGDDEATSVREVFSGEERHEQHGGGDLGEKAGAKELLALGVVADGEDGEVNRQAGHHAGENQTDDIEGAVDRLRRDSGANGLGRVRPVCGVRVVTCRVGLVCRVHNAPPENITTAGTGLGRVCGRHKSQLIRSYEGEILVNLISLLWHSILILSIVDRG